MTPASLSRFSVTAFVAAPAIWLVGWVAMRLRTTDGPGALWTTAHSVWIVTFALFGVVVVGISRLARSAGSRNGPLVAVTVVALAGTVATAAQMVLDLVSGLGVADEAAMDARSDAMLSVPGLRLVCYALGPYVLYAGLVLLVVLATVRRVVRGWQLVAVLAAVAALGVGHGLPGVFRVVEGLGAVLLLVALAGIARSNTSAPAGVSAPAAP